VRLTSAWRSMGTVARIAATTYASMVARSLARFGSRPESTAIQSGHARARRRLPDSVRTRARAEDARGARPALDGPPGPARALRGSRAQLRARGPARAGRRLRARGPARLPAQAGHRPRPLHRPGGAAVAGACGPAPAVRALLDRHRRFRPPPGDDVRGRGRRDLLRLAQPPRLAPVLSHPGRGLGRGRPLSRLQLPLLARAVQRALAEVADGGSHGVRIPR
jgi:hypothetical protein